MKHFYQSIQGWFDFQDLYSAIVKSLSNESHIVEIGAWKGTSSAYMAVEIINSKKSIKFDCIDTWQGSEVDEHQQDPDIQNLFETFINNMKPVAGFYNPIRLPSVDAAKLYNDASLDFVFIDGAHDYENVCADIIAWLPKVKIGGYLGGHDYFYPPVNNAVKKLLKGTNCKSYGRSSWIMKKE